MLILTFFLPTLGFGYFTWRCAILNPRAQGPYRFVAFEGITAIVLLNYKVWFADFLSPLQIVSFAALIISIYLALARMLPSRVAASPRGISNIRPSW